MRALPPADQARDIRAKPVLDGPAFSAVRERGGGIQMARCDDPSQVSVRLAVALAAAARRHAQLAVDVGRGQQCALLRDQLDAHRDLQPPVALAPLGLPVAPSRVALVTALAVGPAHSVAQLRSVLHVALQRVHAARQPSLAARDAREQPQHAHVHAGRHVRFGHPLRGQQRYDPPPQLPTHLQLAQRLAVQERQDAGCREGCVRRESASHVAQPGWALSGSSAESPHCWRRGSHLSR